MSFILLKPGFSWHNLGPFILISDGLNVTACLNIVAGHVHPYGHHLASCNGHFQHNDEPFHKANGVSNWFYEHDNVFSLVQWPLQLPDLNPSEHLWGSQREVFIILWNSAREESTKLGRG